MWSKLAFAAALSVAVVDGANWNPKSVYNAINTDTANDMQTYDKCNASDDTAFVKPEDRYCLNGPPSMRAMIASPVRALIMSGAGPCARI